MNIKTSTLGVDLVSEDSITLGQVLASARKSCKLTQQELCAKTGVAYSTLTKIERGAIKKPNVFTVFQIAQATNLKIDDLMRFGGQEQSRQTLIDDNFNSSSRLSSDVNQAQAQIKFIYFDVHQVLINSTSQMMTILATKYNCSLHQIKDLYLRYNHQLCSGQISLQDFNQHLCQILKYPNIDWGQAYLQATQPNQLVQRACRWAMQYFKVGLFTNAFPTNIKNLIKHQIIPQDYAVIVDSSEVGMVKPYQEIYDYAQAQTGLLPQEILLVDDRQINIIAAQNYGWQTFWLTDHSLATLWPFLQGLRP